MGAEVSVAAGGRVRLELEDEFEHIVLALSGALTVSGTPLADGSMLSVDRGRGDAAVEADKDAHALLSGGVPFDEELLMWWNFVARNHDEILAVRTSWEAARANTTRQYRFSSVSGYAGASLPAAELPHVRLRSRGR